MSTPLLTNIKVQLIQIKDYMVSLVQKNIFNEKLCYAFIKAQSIKIKTFLYQRISIRTPVLIKEMIGFYIILY